MGLNFLSSNCTVYPEEKCFAPNPNPARFKIVTTLQVGDNLVAQIKYPDCINFEGSKILLFLATDKYELKSRTAIDPHFDDNSKSPFARFKPNQEGWDAAVELATLL